MKNPGPGDVPQRIERGVLLFILSVASAFLNLPARNPQLTNESSRLQHFLRCNRLIDTARQLALLHRPAHASRRFLSRSR